MNDAAELLRDYYETLKRERDLKWDYDQCPGRKAEDKEKRKKLFNDWYDTRDRRYALEDRVESFIMTRVAT